MHKSGRCKVQKRTTENIETKCKRTSKSGNVERRNDSKEKDKLESKRKSQRG